MQSSLFRFSLPFVLLASIPLLQFACVRSSAVNVSNTSGTTASKMERNVAKAALAKLKADLLAEGATSVDAKAIVANAYAEMEKVVSFLALNDDRNSVRLFQALTRGAIYALRDHGTDDQKKRFAKVIAKSCVSSFEEHIGDLQGVSRVDVYAAVAAEAVGTIKQALPAALVNAAAADVLVVVIASMQQAGGAEADMTTVVSSAKDALAGAGVSQGEIDNIIAQVPTVARPSPTPSVTSTGDRWYLLPQNTAGYDSIASNYMHDVVVSNGKIFVGTNAGLSISSDGGSTWITKTTANGLGSNNVGNLSVSNGVVYASTTGGLSISSDGGSTWITKTVVDGLGSNDVGTVRVYGNKIYAATETSVSVSTDGGGTWVARGAGNGGEFEEIFVDGNVIYASIYLHKDVDGDESRGFYTSLNDGVTWVRKSFPGSEWVEGIFVSNGKIFLGTSSGLLISSDGGSSWVKKTTADGLGDDNVGRIFGFGGAIYTGTGWDSDEGLSISTDGGATWATKTTANGLWDDGIRAVFVSDGKIYVISSEYDSPNSRLCISSDGGDSWRVVPGAKYAIGQHWLGELILAGSRFFWNNPDGLQHSADGGATWKTITQESGLGVDEVNDLIAVGDYLFAATDGGVAISQNGGETWVTKTSSNGLGSNRVSRLVALDGIIYAATSGGLSSSSDNGSTWTTKTSADGLAGSSVRDVAVSGGKVFAATDGGLSVSMNGGSSWATKIDSCGAEYPGEIRSVQVAGNSVFATCEYQVLDDVWSFVERSRLFVSLDGGSTWGEKSTSDGPGNERVFRVFISGGVVFVAGRDGYPGSVPWGVSFSTDGGATWTTKTVTDGLGSNDVTDVLVSDGKFYAGTAEGISISDDGGKTWSSKTGPYSFGRAHVGHLFVLEKSIYASTGNGLAVLNPTVPTR
jgi:hypothetical protein